MTQRREGEGGKVKRKDQKKNNSKKTIFRDAPAPSPSPPFLFTSPKRTHTRKTRCEGEAARQVPSRFTDASSSRGCCVDHPGFSGYFRCRSDISQPLSGPVAGRRPTLVGDVVALMGKSGAHQTAPSTRRHLAHLGPSWPIWPILPVSQHRNATVQCC